ncbi:hypothetical protein, partial [Streptomyces sp. P17]|uniref:hypothetical protein n=1 Tax=Streptomyces sp. P17 TaxID=3074716 RepID=UPI0028F445B3
VAQAIDGVLADRELVREQVDAIVRHFIEAERAHIAMEERDFFPVAVKALKPEDWAEIAATGTPDQDPLFSDVAEQEFDALRAHILR